MLATAYSPLFVRATQREDQRMENEHNRRGEDGERMKARVVQLSRALAQHSGESATEGGRPRPRQGRPGDLEARNGRNKFPKALPPSFPPSLSSLHFVRNAAFNDGDTTKHDKTRENECSRTRKEARRIRLHLGSRANANANKVTIHCDAGESEMKGRKLATDADKRHHGEEDVERFFSAHARCTAASAAAAVTVSTSQVSQDGRAARFDETPSSLTHSPTTDWRAGKGPNECDTRNSIRRTAKLSFLGKNGADLFVERANKISRAKSEGAGRCTSLPRQRQ